MQPKISDEIQPDAEELAAFHLWNASKAVDNLAETAHNIGTKYSSNLDADFHIIVGQIDKDELREDLKSLKHKLAVAQSRISLTAKALEVTKAENDITPDESHEQIEHGKRVAQ